VDDQAGCGSWWALLYVKNGIFIYLLHAHTFFRMSRLYNIYIVQSVYDKSSKYNTKHQNSVKMHVGEILQIENRAHRMSLNVSTFTIKNGERSIEFNNFSKSWGTFFRISDGS
jgi:hypothetical protein